jgi:uncharacterized protein YdeI (YjbR/CyaY-like superfamily)
MDRMGATRLPGGVVHDLPADFEEALQADGAASATWRDITPLARNEWICWVEDAKKTETREKRIRWGRENLSEGKRRPCCWPGCRHR